MAKMSKARASEFAAVTTGAQSKPLRNSQSRQRRRQAQEPHTPRMRTKILSFLFAVTLLDGTATLWAKKESTTQAVQPRQLSLLRVNVTGQGYDYFRPWQKRAPFSKRALGAVLSQGRVLVTADLVANQNYVELERAESGEKIP